MMIAALATPSLAQVRVGDNVSMNLNAEASFGYTADYGNTIPSDHNLNFGGTANLTGSYYTPNFLNFNVNPYYNQSRANSTSQAISDSSGVNANVPANLTWQANNVRGQWKRAFVSALNVAMMASGSL